MNVICREYGLECSLGHHKTITLESLSPTNIQVPLNIHDDQKAFLDQYKRNRTNDKRNTVDDKRNTVDDKRNTVDNTVDGTAETNPQNMSRIGNKKAVHAVLNGIIGKVQNELQRSNEYKLFSGILRTKKDLQRLQKERRFMQSQTRQNQHKSKEKRLQGISLQIPHRRIRTEAVQSQEQLQIKAREFAERVKREQQELYGKSLLRRKIQQQKRERKEKEERRKYLQQWEIKKEERKVKAEENMLILRQKVKIAQIMKTKRYLSGMEKSQRDSSGVLSEHGLPEEEYQYVRRRRGTQIYANQPN